MIYILVHNSWTVGFRRIKILFYSDLNLIYLDFPPFWIICKTFFCELVRGCLPYFHKIKLEIISGVWTSIIIKTNWNLLPNLATTLHYIIVIVTCQLIVMGVASIHTSSCNWSRLYPISTTLVTDMLYLIWRKHKRFGRVLLLGGTMRSK